MDCLRPRGAWSRSRYNHQIPRRQVVLLGGQVHRTGDRPLPDNAHVDGGKARAGVGSPYGAINYLLFRVYEAAHRLQQSPLDDEWAQFLESQRTRYPGIDTDMADVVRSLDRLWILRLDSQYDCELTYDERRAS
jgi:hypothetical protein